MHLIGSTWNEHSLKPFVYFTCEARSLHQTLTQRKNEKKKLIAAPKTDFAVAISIDDHFMYDFNAEKNVLLTLAFKFTSDGSWQMFTFNMHPPYDANMFRKVDSI